MTVFELKAKAKKLYPNSKNMQRQWVHQTAILLNRGVHLLQTGKFRFK